MGKIARQISTSWGVAEEEISDDRDDRNDRDDRDDKDDKDDSDD